MITELKNLARKPLKRARRRQVQPMRKSELIGWPLQSNGNALLTQP
jgi:hypothetical protein